MSRSTTRRVIPGIVTLGLAAGAVLTPNAAFAAPVATDAGTAPAAATQGTVSVVGIGLGAVLVTNPTDGAIDVIAKVVGSDGAVSSPLIDTVAARATRAVELPDFARYLGEGQTVQVVTLRLLNQFELELATLDLPSGIPVVTPEPQPARTPEIDHSRLTSTDSVPPRVPQSTPVSTSQATPERPSATNVPQQPARPQATPAVTPHATPEPESSLTVVTEAVPPLLPQGVPTATPGQPIEEFANFSVITDAVAPELTPAVPQTLVPVEESTSVTIPLESTSTGSQTPSVAVQQTPIPATATGGSSVVDNGVDDSTVSASGGADTPQVAAAAQSERTGGDAPAATLSHTGVDDSTLALGGAGLGAVILGGALLALRRVRG
ncbi:hypothetical protein [Demequina silvatica]|uniref:hypothetical protein n=1 Tax=Demequina silvatica TaxID=1638988 RepID=UPI000782CB18|nr:hypothetical protein [Demequina silvatica]